MVSSLVSIHLHRGDDDHAVGVQRPFSPWVAQDHVSRVVVGASDLLLLLKMKGAEADRLRTKEDGAGGGRAWELVGDWMEMEREGREMLGIRSWDLPLSYRGMNQGRGNRAIVCLALRGLERNCERALLGS